MNALLLNPFAEHIPDSVNATFDNAEATLCRFNKGTAIFAGHYLAVGRTDGLVVIWDVETKSVLRALEGHVKPVTSLAWSTNNRYLVSASADWNVIVWDLAAQSPSQTSTENNPDAARGIETGERKRTIRFDAPIASAEFAFKDSRRLLVVLETQQAFLVQLQDQVRVRRRRRRRTEPEQMQVDQPGPSRLNGTAHAQDELVTVEEVKTSPIKTELLPDLAEDEAGKASTSGITAASFSPDGERIFAGTSKGAILIFDARTGDFMGEYKVLGTSSGVKELAFAPSGRHLVVNTNDRAIRIVHVVTSVTASGDTEEQATKRRKVGVELSVLHKIQDLVNRTPWNGIGFSGDSDYVVGGAAHKAAHNVYIWDRSAGTLVKILEGPKDSLVNVDWHPNRPVLASVSNTGAIYIWFTPTEEIWSAYAPGFEELDENVEYEEREDEFDMEDEEEVSRRKQDEEEALVDVMGHERLSNAKRLCDPLEGLVIQHGGGCDAVWQRVLDPSARNGTSLSNGIADNAPEAQGGEWEEMVSVHLVGEQDTDASFGLPPRLEEDYGFLQGYEA